MIYIDERYYLSRFPKTDYVFENLDNNLKKIFLTRYSIYMNFLYDYLIDKTDIKKFDDNLKNNIKNEFSPIDKENKDMYQFMANGKLEYYYIRNNINLSNLSEEEIAFIDNRIKNNDFTYDDEVEKFIESTLKKVISFSNDENISINFGPGDSSSFYVKNGSLIIGQRISEFVSYDLKKYENQIKYFKRNSYLEQMNNDLKISMFEKLVIPVSVIRYTDQTVKLKDDVEDKNTTL